MKTVIKALLAASMLMPIAAQAQEQDGRGPGRRGGDWGERAPRGDRGGPDRGGPAASADLGLQVQGRAERPQPAPEARGPGQGWRGGDRGGDRGGWQNARPPQPAPQQPDQDWRRRDRPDGGNDWRRGDRPGAGNDWRRDDRTPPRPDWRQPGSPQARNEWRGNDRRDWDRRDDNRRDWNGNAGWNGNRGGAWNRGWRNDDRYDWGRNRQLNRGLYRLPRYYAPSGWGYGYRRFSVGVSLSSILFSRNYWIDDPYAYRLPEVYGPYRWVRYYDDALLVDIRTGMVVDTVYDIFY
ncbi:MAG: RcnB family protein [Sphingomonas taxi]